MENVLISVLGSLGLAAFLLLVHALSRLIGRLIPEGRVKRVLFGKD